MTFYEKKHFLNFLSEGHVSISDAAAGRCDNSNFDQLITLKFKNKNDYMNITMVPKGNSNPFHMLGGSGHDDKVRSDQDFSVTFTG